MCRPSLETTSNTCGPSAERHSLSIVKITHKSKTKQYSILPDVEYLDTVRSGDAASKITLGYASSYASMRESSAHAAPIGRKLNSEFERVSGMKMSFGAVFRRALLGGVAALLNPGASFAYPVDCAILLCLAGGWPASAECSHARAVFIRRITPWPIEPPLQIWRCPMGIALNEVPAGPLLARFQSVALMNGASTRQTTNAVFQIGEGDVGKAIAAQIIAARATGTADIDISDPAFDFVRSLRVYHMEFRQRRSRDECHESDSSRLGTYGQQGGFAWRRHNLRSGYSAGSQPTRSLSWNAPPQSAVHRVRWGGDCPNISFRAVGVYWEDFEGVPGYEEVRY